MPFKTEYPTDGMVVLEWTGLTNGTTGETGTTASYRDRSVQVTGTFGVGGTVVIEGSNNGTTWHTLRDSNETPLSFMSADLAVILEPTRYIRPRVTGGDGSTNLSVTIVGISGC